MVDRSPLLDRSSTRVRSRSSGSEPMAGALIASLTLRPATAHDFAFCEHLSRTNMAGYRAARGFAWDPARFRASWTEFENLMIVAGDEAIGLLRLLPEGEALGLRDLQIVPARQCQGVGGWAVRQAQAITMQRGHRRLQLRVYVENAARVLYARLGFAVESEAEGTLHMAWTPRPAVR
jgi:GNAT superfamily N-acetyltransferase